MQVCSVVFQIASDKRAPTVAMSDLCVFHDVLELRIQRLQTYVESAVLVSSATRCRSLLDLGAMTRQTLCFRRQVACPPSCGVTSARLSHGLCRQASERPLRPTCQFHLAAVRRPRMGFSGFIRTSPLSQSIQRGFWFAMVLVRWEHSLHATRVLMVALPCHLLTRRRFKISCSGVHPMGVP